MLKFYYFLQSKIQSTELKLSEKIRQRINEPYGSKVFYFNLIYLNFSLISWQIFCDVLKFLFILVKDPGVSFNILFKQKELRSCPFSYHYFKNLTTKIRIFSLSGITAIVIVAVVSSLVTNFLFGGKNPSKAASFGWLQNSWADGLDITSVINPSDRNALWKKYAFVSNAIFANSNVELRSVAATSTQTNYQDFLSGAITNAELIGATDASLKLKRTANSTTYGSNFEATPSFQYPRGIAVDVANNKVFVVDTGNRNRVVKFDSGFGGTTWGENFQTFGGSAQFNAPQGLFLDAGRNKLYLVDTQNRRIAKFDSGSGGTTFGGNLQYFGTSGTGAGKFGNPASITVDTVNNKAYVTDISQDTVFKFNSGGADPMTSAGWQAFGSVGTGVGQFSDPTGVSLDTINNLLYVADKSNNRIVRFDSGGASGSMTVTNWKTLGTLGSGVGQFNGANDVLVDPINNFVYAVDYQNKRYVKFLANDGGGNLATTTWDVRIYGSWIEVGLALDLTNNVVYANQTWDNSVARFSATDISSNVGVKMLGNGGTDQQRFYYPEKIFVDTKYNKVYVTDAANNRIVKFDSGQGGTIFGSNRQTITGVGNFSNPSGIFVDIKYNRVYVTDAGNNRIVKFDSGGSGPMSTTTFWHVLTGFSGINGIYVDNVNNKVYITKKYDNNVNKFNSGGAGNMNTTGMQTLGSTGAGVGQFSGPVGISVDVSRGMVYVVEETNNRVVKFSSGGAGAMSTSPWYVMGGTAAGNLTGQFNAPKDVSVDTLNSKVFVSDYNNKRMVKFIADNGTGAMASTTWNIFLIPDENVSGTFIYRNRGVYVDSINAKVFSVDSDSHHRIIKFDSGEPTALYAAAGNYISPTIYLGQKSNGLPMSFGWNESLADLAGANQIKFQIASDNYGTFPNASNTPDLAGVKYLGIGGYSTSSVYNIEVQSLGNGYRLYYTENTGTYTRLAYRDTIDNVLPNENNLGPATVMLGTSNSNQAGFAKVMPLNGGGYRLYYSYHDGTHWRLAYRDTSDSSLPNSSNLLAQNIINSSLGSTEHEYTSDIVSYGSNYRIYYTYYGTGINHQIAYRQTNDNQLPDVSNLGDRQIVDSVVSSSDKSYGPKFIQMGANSHRLYYSHYDGAKWHLDYADFATPPDSVDLSSVGQSLNTGNGASDAAITQTVYQLSNGVYRLYFGYSPNNTYWNLAYKDIWTFNGPDGTPNSYFTASAGTAINSLQNGASSYRYKINLTSDFQGETPSVNEVRLSYKSYGYPAPLVLYHFDGVGSIVSNTSIIDSSGNNSYAISSNVNASGMSYVNGVSSLGKAVLFDGTDDSILTTKFPPSILTSFTMETWLKASSSDATGTAISIAADTSGATAQSSIGINSGNLIARIGQGGSTTNFGELVTVNNNYNDDQWHHLAVTWDGTTKTGTLYVDGQIAASSVFVGTISSTTAYAKFGSGMGNAFGQYTGLLDDAAIHARALSAEEILGHYNGGLPAPLDDGVQPALLISSPYDTQSPANMLSNIGWTNSLFDGNQIKFRIRTAPASSTDPTKPGIWSPWMGSATGTWFTLATGLESMPEMFRDFPVGGASDQFIQYEAALYSDGSSTPSLTNVTTSYVVNGPPIVNITSAIAQSDAKFINIPFSVFDEDTASGTYPGKVWVALQYCTDSTFVNCPETTTGTGWQYAATTSISSTDFTTDFTVPNFLQMAVNQDGSSASSSLNWNPTIDWPNQYRSANNFKVRLIVYDKELVNHTSYATSTSFELDTTPPVPGIVSVQATATPATVKLNASDDNMTGMLMRYSVASTSFNGYTDDNGWLPYGNFTIDLNNVDPSTVYVQYKDVKGNVSSRIQAITPETPQAIMIQDTSNMQVLPTPEYKLFVAWKIAPAMSPGFNRYIIMRSPDEGVTYEYLGEVTDHDQNYYSDNTMAYDVYTYYKVAIEDDNGNISFLSTFVKGKANGIYDPGEGSGPGLGGEPSSAPEITNIASSSVYATQANITWDTNVLADSKVEYVANVDDFISPNIATSVSMVSQASSTIGGHKITLNNLTPETIYYFRVTSANLDGVTATSTSYSFVTKAGAAISNVTVTAIKNTEATISWHTDQNDSSYFGYSTSPKMIDSVETDTEDAAETVCDSGVCIHSVTRKNLLAGQTYFFYVKSGQYALDDNGGNYYTFTTTNDQAAPAISVDVDTLIQKTDTSAVINWSTNEPSTGLVQYGTSTTNLVASSSNFNVDQQIVLTNLEPGILYRFTLSNTDINGNTANNLTEYTFTTDSAPDTIAPIIAVTGDPVKSTTKDSATVEWLTIDEPASTYVQYAATTTNFEQIYIQVGREEASTSHSVIIRGLSQGQTYFYRMKSVDLAGNTAYNPSEADTFREFTTNDGPIITLDSEPIAVSETTALLKWTTDKVSDGYVVYDENNDFSTTKEKGASLASTTHSIMLNSLTSDTIYYFKLRSTDENGNPTAKTDPAYTFRTGKDETRPTFIAGPAATSTSDNSTLITWSTNEFSRGSISYGLASTTLDNETATTSEFNMDLTQLLSGLTAKTKYYYMVTAVDAAGNILNSLVKEFTTKERLYEESEVQGQVASSTVGMVTKAELDAANVALAKARADLELAQSVKPSSGGAIFIDKTDKVAPKISNIKVTDLKADSAKISWLTDEETFSFVRYGMDSNYSKSFGDYELVKTHSAVLENLEPDKNYSYRVAGIDSSGNLATGPDLTFTTPSVAEQLTAEGKSLEEIKQAEQQANTENQQSREQTLIEAAKKAMEIVSSVASTVSLGTLETTLFSQYDAIEKLANSIPAPIMGGEPGVVTSATTATIAWLTNKDANSLVAYSPENIYKISENKGDAAYVQVVGNSDDKIKNHLVKIIDLKPETTYHYQLRSKAELGPIGRSRDFTFTTKAQTLEISNYTIQNISTEKATFRWITNTETDSKLIYTPYRGNKLAVEESKTLSDKAMTTIHEITADNFEGGTIYQVELTGKDVKGNSASRTIEAYSTSADDLPPQIFQVQTESALSTGKETRVQTIISWQTNEPTLGQVSYVKGVNTKEDSFAEKTQLENSYTKKHVVVITKFEPGTVYSFRASAIDSAGNQTLSKTYTILTPRQKDSVFQLILKNFESTFGWVGKMGG